MIAKHTLGPLVVSLSELFLASSIQHLSETSSLYQLACQCAFPHYSTPTDTWFNNITTSKEQRKMQAVIKHFLCDITIIY